MRKGVIADAGFPAAVQQVATAKRNAKRAPGAGPIDLAATADGSLLYVQNTLAGTVEGFRVADNGSLTLVTTLHKGLPVFADGTAWNASWSGDLTGGRQDRLDGLDETDVRPAPGCSGRQVR